MSVEEFDPEAFLEGLPDGTLAWMANQLTVQAPNPPAADAVRRQFGDRLADPPLALRVVPAAREGVTA